MNKYYSMPEQILFCNKIDVSLTNFLSTQSYSNIFLLCDTNTKKYCLPFLKESVNLFSINILTISAGEKHKNLDTIHKIWNFLLNKNADRNSLLINLGGGVVTDIGGFVASTFKRGIDYINIPTTLLAMLDASIGGKTGINFNAFKNEIGTFYFPKKIIVFTPFLHTLTKRHLLSGFAECIKHALIFDARLWNKLIKIDINTASTKQLEPIIKKSIAIKNHFIQHDPYEHLGTRQALNFGHTFGHALESFFMNKKNKLLHGEAVAYGLIFESYLSCIKLNLSIKKYQNIKHYILTTFGRLPISSNNIPSIIKLMQYDKKNVNQQITFTLISTIGSYSLGHSFNKKEIYNAFIEANLL